MFKNFDWTQFFGMVAIVIPAFIGLMTIKTNVRDKEKNIAYNTLEKTVSRLDGQVKSLEAKMMKLEKDLEKKNNIILELRTQNIILTNENKDLKEELSILKGDVAHG